jgi:hypothetical protein
MDPDQIKSLIEEALAISPDAASLRTSIISVCGRGRPRLALSHEQLIKIEAAYG